MHVLAILLLTFALTAWAGENDRSIETTASNGGAGAYKAKVGKQVSESVVNSLVREWGVSEEQARCLLGDLRASQLGRAASDPAVQEVFRRCDVDPTMAH